ncbi:Required for respiratory growth protein 9 mitochondrial [Trapelia coarctata]|nr:Required for respiratory growth protein 9 mitochondrial [Trapelia coarctata]
MPCSSCSADLLRTFLRTFNIQPTQILQGHAIRPIQGRALHTRPALCITPGTSRPFGHGAVGDLPITSFDNVYVPFDRSKAKPGWSEDSSPSKNGEFSVFQNTPATAPLLGEIQSGTQSIDDAMEAETFWGEPKVRIRDPLREQKAVDRDEVQKTMPSSRDAGQTRDVRSSKQRLPNKRQGSASSFSKGTLKPDSKPTFRPRSEFPRSPREPWQIQKAALEQKFGSTGWEPRKRLSPDALDGIRAIHAQYPETYTTEALAERFKVSPEAIRRILKSKWRPNEEEDVSRRQRWQKRGEAIWGQMVELGVKPPKKWREMGVGRKSGVGEKKRELRGGVPFERAEEGGIEVVDEYFEAHNVDHADREYMGRTLSERIL